MHSFTTLVTVAVLAVGAIAQQFTINTPYVPSRSLILEPILTLHAEALMLWSASPQCSLGAVDHLLTTCVLPGATPDGTAIEDLGTFNGTSYSWTVNIAGGTYIDLTLRDSTGAIAQSAPFSIQPGSTACATTTTAPSSTSGASSTSSSSGASTSSSASTTSGSSTGSSTASSSTSSGSSTSSAPATTSTTSGASSAKAVQISLAVVIAAAVVAVCL